MKKKKTKLSLKEIKKRFEEIYGKKPKEKELKQYVNYLKSIGLIR